MVGAFFVMLLITNIMKRDAFKISTREKLLVLTLKTNNEKNTGK